MPSLGIRVDAGKDLGLGHLFRCMALIEGSVFSAPIFFSKTATLVARIVGRDRVIKIPADASIDEEWCIVQSYLRASPLSALLFDLLRYPDGYFQKFSALHLPMVSLHEMETENVGTHLMINCNPFRGYRDQVPHAACCLGPEYVIVRDAIVHRERPRQIGNVHTVLITMGGSDPGGITLLVLRALQHCSAPLEFFVHVGPSFKYRDALQNIIPSLDARFQVLENVAELGDYMAAADLAIAAGGNTMYELCCLGVPTIVIAQGAHQLEFADQLAAVGGVMSLGWYSQITALQIREAFEQLCGNADARAKMSCVAQGLIDGAGRQRIVDRMVQLVS